MSKVKLFYDLDDDEKDERTRNFFVCIKFDDFAENSLGCHSFGTHMQHHQRTNPAFIVANIKELKIFFGEEIFSAANFYLWFVDSMKSYLHNFQLYSSLIQLLHILFTLDLCQRLST